MQVGDFLDGGGAQGDPQYAQVETAITSRGARRVPAVAGTSWSCGDLRIRVIAPSAAQAARKAADANEIAAVTVATVGGIALLSSGDAESPQLASLPLPNVDILKVPHHGSADPGLPAVLARSDPEIAGIEVGEDNTYGHPTAQTLGTLGAAGAAVYRTDRDGTVLAHEVEQGAIQLDRWRLP
jgi:competence protein ComEC